MKQAKQNRKQKKEYYDNDRKHQLKLTQQVFNQYVRVRDMGRQCISCDKPDNGTHQRHASHYRPATHQQLRFNELNCHSSCQQCNTTKSGNLTEYRPRLIAKIGEDKVIWLESKQPGYKYTLDDLKEIREYYKSKINELKG